MSFILFLKIFFNVYLFQLAFERHLAPRGNNHFTYALWSVFITRQLRNRCLQSRGWRGGMGRVGGAGDG